MNKIYKKISGVLLIYSLSSALSFSQCVTISVPTDTIVYSDSSSCGVIVNYPTPTAVNSCNSTTTFSYTGSLQTFIVPAGVTSINIEAVGAQGGSVTTTCAANGGLGARMSGDVAVNPGDQIDIMVGQQGFTNGADAGGGGGTFVVLHAGNVPLVIAGGGGGATNNIGSCGANRNGLDAVITTNGTASGNGLVAGGTGGNGGGASSGSGGGGGGFLTDGVAGMGLANNNGKSYLNGGAGGTGNNNDFGGYGGGGAGWFTGGNGGGGGGYSGGGTSGNQPFTGGGGGGSYNIGTNQSNSAGYQSGNGYATFTYPSSYTITQIAGLPSGSTFPVGTTINTFVVNGSGSADTASFTITVTDTIAPWFTTIVADTVVVADSSCDAVVTFTNPMATDNCPSTVVAQSAGPPSGTLFPLGNYYVEFMATDNSGNLAVIGYFINVVEQEIPSITCPSNVTSCLTNITGIGASVSDLCTGIDSTTYTFTGSTTGTGSGDASGSTFNLGTTTVNYTTVDLSGNTNSCSFTVQVLDCSSIEDAGDLSNVQAYPNPTNGTVNISLGKEYSELQITLTQLNGSVVWRKETNNTDNIQLSLEELAPGIYFVQLQSENQVRTIKLVRN